LCLPFTRATRRSNARFFLVASIPGARVPDSSLQICPLRGTLSRSGALRSPAFSSVQIYYPRGISSSSAFASSLDREVKTKGGLEPGCSLRSTQPDAEGGLETAQRFQAPDRLRGARRAGRHAAKYTPVPARQYRTCLLAFQVDSGGAAKAGGEVLSGFVLFPKPDRTYSSGKVLSSVNIR
jgi:hypothetical protein